MRSEHFVMPFAKHAGLVVLEAAAIVAVCLAAFWIASLASDRIVHRALTIHSSPANSP